MASKSEKYSRSRKKHDGEEGARPYQLDLLDAAIDANTIVALGTGAGKTFIAVMLIKEYSHEIVGSFKHDAKRTFFLVPNVPLVKQQAQYIQQHTHLNVGEFTGDMNVDSWEQNRWIEEFENYSVLVMTKQILLNLLKRGFIVSKNINLLVLDECHHAVKNDSYVEIMNVLHSCPEHQRPRVLGLSASILPSKCKPGHLEKSIRKLEETLHCRAQTAGDLAEVTRFAATPEIKYLDYSLSENDQQSKRLKSFVTEPLEFLEKFKEGMKKRTYKIVKGHFDDCVHILDNLGLWCAHRFASDALEELKGAKVKDEGDLWETALLHLAVTHLRIFEQEARTLLDVQHTRTSATAKVERLLLELGDHAVVNGMLSDGAIRGAASEGGDGAVSEGGGDSPSSSAVNAGTRVVARSRPDRLLGIVFVERRTTALLLAEVINRRSQEDPDLKHIQCDYLVGHSSGTNSGDTYLRKEARMTHKKQNKQLQRFRGETINLLIATGVVEEGLDVPKCNMVCRFDLPPNFRSYIQSKGRARAKGSMFYLLVDMARAAEQKRMIDDYRLLEEELNAICHERVVPDEEGEEEWMERLAPPYEPFGKGSDVRATLLSSRSMVHKYCQTLHADRYTIPSPVFICAECQAGCSNILEGAHQYKFPWFRCYLRLPYNSPISNKIMMGPTMPRKQWAEKAAALEAIRILHEAKELDDRLMPVTRRVGEEDEDDEDEGCRGERDAGTQKRSQMYKKETAANLLASCPKAGIDSFLYIFVLQEGKVAEGRRYYQSPGSNEGPHPSFGLLMSKPIPHSRLPLFPLYVKDRELSVTIHRHCTTVSLSAEELHLLARCHDALFTEVLRFCVQSATEGGNTAAEGLKDYLCVPVGFMEPTVAYIDLEMAKIIAGMPKSRFSPVGWPCPLESLSEDRLIGVCHRDSTMGQGKALELYQVVRVDPSVTPASEFPEYSTTFASYFKAKYDYDLTDLGQPALVCVPVGTQCLQLTTSRYKAANGRDLEVRSQSHGDTERVFFPQQCKVYCLPAHMMHLAMCVPSLLWRLENLLLVEDLRALISSETKVGVNRSGQELTTRTVLHGYRDEGCNTSEVRCYDPADGSYADVPRTVSPSGPRGVGPDCGLLLQALTPRGANDIINLERLETLGDAFLKLVSALSVWGAPSDRRTQISNLTRARSNAVGNLNLYTLAVKKGLPGRVQSDFRPREAWLPPRFAPPPQGEQDVPASLGSSPWLHQRITDKCVADCVEALTGAYLVAGGLSAGLSFLVWMGFLGPGTSSGEPDCLTVGTNSDPFHVLIQHSCSTLHSSFGPLLTTPIHSQLLVDGLGTRVPVDDLDALIRRCMGTSGPPTVLGWTFRDSRLFVQAFTHSSYARNWITDWYKRLEFLGDAVLDYLVTSHIYATKTRFTPGEISGARSALVNNGSFAEAVVRERVHTHLLHTSPTLFRHLQQYVSAMEQKALEQGGKEEDWDPVGGDYEPEEMELDPPKVLGDLLESLMGAIFIDSGMDLEAVWRVFIKVFRDKIGECEDSIPVTPLQQLYEMMPTVKMKIKGVSCTITVQEKAISETVSAHSAQASKQIAARRVIRRLQVSETKQ